MCRSFLDYLEENSLEEVRFADILQEMTLWQLHRSTVKTFDTKRRERSAKYVARNVITGLTPKGQLVIRSHLTGVDEYEAIMLFKFLKENPQGNVRIKLTSGGEFKVKPYDIMAADVEVNCTCPDYRFRFSYYNKNKGAQFGPIIPYKRKTTWMPSVNPAKTPGMCKHLLAMARTVGINIPT